MAKQSEHQNQSEPEDTDITMATQADGLSVSIDENLTEAIKDLSLTIRTALGAVETLASALRPTSVTSQITRG